MSIYEDCDNPDTYESEMDIPPEDLVIKEKYNRLKDHFIDLNFLGLKETISLEDLVKLCQKS